MTGALAALPALAFPLYPKRKGFWHKSATPVSFELILSFLTVFGRSAGQVVLLRMRHLQVAKRLCSLDIELHDQRHRQRYRDSQMAAYAPNLRPLKDDDFAFGHAEKPRKAAARNRQRGARICRLSPVSRFRR